MLPSFFAPDFSPPSEFAGSDLPQGTRRHLRSRRIDAGERFWLMNGAGQIAECEALDARNERFRTLTLRQQPAIQPRIEVCSSPPRGDALAELATQATEVGAAALRFFRSDHNQYPSGAKVPPADRAQRVSDAACEQCARAWRLPVDGAWNDLKRLVADPDFTHVVADETLAGTAAAPTPPPSLKGFRLYLGPEGGWSATERQFFDGARVHRLSLGALILRVPTAAVAGIYHLLRLSEASGRR